MKRERTLRIFLSYAFTPWQKAYEQREIKAMLDRAVKSVDKRDSIAGRNARLVPDYALEVGRVLREEIHKKIRSSDMAVVDISDNNPNVMYELGYMDALGKYPPILLKSNKEKDTYTVPSDINNIHHIPYDHIDDAEAPLADTLEAQAVSILDARPGRNEVRELWYGKHARAIHVIASKSQVETEFSSTTSSNYDRFHEMGDKTAVWETLVLLAKLYPNAEIAVHVADKFDMRSGMFRDNLVVIGGPGFEDDGNRVCRMLLQRVNSKVSYTEDYETMLADGDMLTASSEDGIMKQDYGYFARFRNPHNPDTAVVMIHGIHTLGVLGAARAFSDHAASVDNVKWALERLGSDPRFESWFPVGVTDGVVDMPLMKNANLAFFSDIANTTHASVAEPE